jgi:tetratricopeptide (TPR) repeat protein
LVYGPDLLNKYHYIRLNNPQALDILKVSGTDAVAVPIGKQLWPVRRALDESPEWQICFFDDKSVIFLMKNERNREWLEKWGLTKIDPLVTGYIKSEARQADSTIIMEEALRAHEQSPDAVTTNAVLARAYFLDSEFIKAAEHYKKAFLLGPALTDFIYQVATSYNRGGEPDSAAVWYEKAIQARSADERSYLEYGVMEAKRGRYAKALEIWKRILKINPRSRARDYIEQMENIMDKAKADSG